MFTTNLTLELKAKCEAVVLNLHDNATEELLELAEKLKAKIQISPKLKSMNGEASL